MAALHIQQIPTVVFLSSNVVATIAIGPQIKNDYKPACITNNLIYTEKSCFILCFSIRKICFILLTCLYVFRMYFKVCQKKKSLKSLKSRISSKLNDGSTKCWWLQFCSLFALCVCFRRCCFKWISYILYFALLWFHIEISWAAQIDVCCFCKWLLWMSPEATQQQKPSCVPVRRIKTCWRIFQVYCNLSLCSFD